MITIPTPPSGTFGSYKTTIKRKKSVPPYIIIVILVMLLLAAGYYFFFYQGVSLSLSSQTLSPAPPLTALEVRVSQLPNFSFDVLDSSFYKSLRIYGNLPVTADSLGRINPFIPY